MPKRMRVAKPVIYEVPEEDRRTAEDSWGWMELGDIARIAGLPPFFVLLRFLEFGSAPMKIRGKEARVFHYQRTPCKDPEDFELRVLDTRYFDTAYEDCWCSGELREVGLNRFFEHHPVRVPARWGAQILTELKKNPITMPV
ncbi:hypothetical protein HYZ80_01720 [Candidatus Parcubacteria bacterium]|nr:hypothetical protein [Candidatus Parcubacteria bacterium]